MKKLFAFLLIAVLVISLTACGSNDTPSTGDESTANHETNNNSGATENTTKDDNDSTFSGDVTEQVVRNYKVAAETDFTVVEVAGGVRISEYLGNDVIVVIPESIGGKSVVAIDGYIFANESPVRGVYVPDSVTTLTGTFPNNDDLEVVICEGVEKIIDGAFLNCEKLHTVVLGESLCELGERAFAGCKALNELYICASLTTIDSSYARMVFYKCENLTIVGESGSYIETFCTEQGIQFQAK